MDTLSKLWKLLVPLQRRSATKLFALMLIGMLLETLGIGLVVPALVLMTQSDLVAQYPFVGPYLEWLGNPTQEHLVIMGMSVLVVVYIVKGAFLAFLAWKQSKFVFGLQASLSQRLFGVYLNQPYTFHLQRNSAQLIRNTTTEVNLLSTVTQSMLMILSEAFVLIGIAVLLLSVEPVGAIVVIVVLGVAGFIFYSATHKHIGRWGKYRQLHEGLRIQHLQQGLAGVKEVKLMGREESFRNRYNSHSNASAHVSQRQTAFQQFPRIWLEILAISGIGGLVFVMLAQGKDIAAIFPVLGLFAAAAFRLMPSVNRVLISLQNLRYAVPVVNILHSEVTQILDERKCEVGALQHEPIRSDISLENIRFKYPDSKDEVLRSINITIRNGSTVGFVGGSGAGKSTVIDLLLGLLEPTSGAVKVDGKNIQENLRAWQNRIGYVPQTIYLNDDSLRGNIAFGLSDDEIDEKAIWNAVKQAQLEEFVTELPDGLATVVGERGVRLSGGQRQRIGIARALYHNPDVLILDEATSALDVLTEQRVMGAVKALHGQKTIVIVAHRFSTVEHADVLFHFDSGCLVDFGSASDVIMAISRSEDC